MYLCDVLDACAPSIGHSTVYELPELLDSLAGYAMYARVRMITSPTVAAELDADRL